VYEQSTYIRHSTVGTAAIPRVNAMTSEAGSSVTIITGWFDGRIGTLRHDQSMTPTYEASYKIRMRMIGLRM
jgi:hypothetical protein